MNTKKSLGYSPIGSPSQGKSDFSFIPNINGDDVEVSDPFEIEERSDSDFFSNRDENIDNSDRDLLVEHGHDAFMTSETDDSVKKKVVSYYLPEILIDRLRVYADNHNESYSGIAADAITFYLRRVESF